MQSLMKTFLLGLLALFGWVNAVAQTVPLKLQARILQLEDERNLSGDELIKLLKHAAPAVRHRVIIALGRIGDARAVTPLLDYLEKYKDETGQPLVVFALGEIESTQAVPKLLTFVELRHPLNARAAEALGKIASVAANAQSLGAATLERINQSIINLLPAPEAKLSSSQRNAAGWCIAALLRLRSPLAVAPLTQQLQSPEAEIRAQAANALSRLRWPINEAVPALIASLSENNSFNDVRANAVRALGVSNDPRAVEPLINALNDKATEVEITAIRSLAQLNDSRAIEPLIQLFEPYRASKINVLLEAAAALTTLKAKEALPALLKVRTAQLPKRWLEFETAVFKLSDDPVSLFPLHGGDAKKAYCQDWRRAAVTAQALTAAVLPTEQETLWESVVDEVMLNGILSQASNSDCDRRSLPATLSAIAKLLLHPSHSNFLNAEHKNRANNEASATYALSLISNTLESSDPYIRAAAASLLSTYDKEGYFVAQLAQALPRSQQDDTNDAKLAILSALAKYKTKPAIAAIKTALKDRDQLVRRHAVNLLKQLEAGDFSVAIGTVQTGRTAAFYQRVVTASQQKLFATITTAKGTIKLELYAQDAPLTVNNFVTLARKGYFNGVAFHRVVPNFVIQGGDPRGTGDGGPGYAIRCEINQRPFGRGALGMALSGKDTGGSQWFITHAPQPHLDGGYTVFGQVVSGMNVVDRITRDDVMQRVVITNR